MGWAGGTYTKGNNSTGGWTGDASLGIGIEAGRHDTQDNDFATGINQCLNKDGSNAATADLPMGGFKHTNVANATGRTNYAAVGQVQDGDYIWLGTTGGTATAQTASATPAITAYKAGQKFRFISGFTTNGAVTLNINNIGSKTILDARSQVSLDTFLCFNSGDIIEVIYNGTNFLWNSCASLSKFSADANPYILAFYKSRGTSVGTNTIVASGDTVGQISFNGATGSSYVTAAAISSEIDATPGSSNDMPGRLRFLTTPDGSSTLTERMRILNNGVVCIGTAASFIGTAGGLCVQGGGTSGSTYSFATANSASGLAFSIADNGAIRTGSLAASPYNQVTGIAANMYVNSVGDLFRSTSSIKYKKDIVDYDKGLLAVLQLKPKYYKSKNGDEQVFAGFIAEDIDALGLHEFVQYAPDSSPDAINYANMTALFAKAIQDLNAKVEMLEARITELEK